MIIDDGACQPQSHKHVELYALLDQPERGEGECSCSASMFSFRKFLCDRCVTHIEGNIGVILAHGVCVRNAFGHYQLI